MLDPVSQRVCVRARARVSVSPNRSLRSSASHFVFLSPLLSFLFLTLFTPLPSLSLPSFPVLLSLTVSLISLPLSISLSSPHLSHMLSPPFLLVSLSLSSSYSVSLPLIFFHCLSPPLSTSPRNSQSLYLSLPLPSMSFSSSVSLYLTHSPSPLLSDQSPSPLISVSLSLPSSFSLSLRPPSLFSSGESETCGSHPSIIHPSNWSSSSLLRCSRMLL